MVFTMGWTVLCEVPIEAKKTRTNHIFPFTSQEQEINYLAIYEKLKETFSVEEISTRNTTHAFSLTE
jgi:hypothetical protein